MPVASAVLCVVMSARYLKTLSLFPAGAVACIRYHSLYSSLLSPFDSSYSLANTLRLMLVYVYFCARSLPAGRSARAAADSRPPRAPDTARANRD